MAMGLTYQCQASHPSSAQLTALPDLDTLSFTGLPAASFSSLITLPSLEGFGILQGLDWADAVWEVSNDEGNNKTGK
jgi:hypothetical protein